MADIDPKALHKDLLRSYQVMRHALFFFDWGSLEAEYRDLCRRYDAHIPSWFANEYVFQAMRLWESDQLDEALRHFANFINRAAGEDIVDASAERDLVRKALDAPPEKPQQ